jgi:murein DD-endopeptidase MepM/ murein hydrolase activator NlpD
MSTFSFSEFLSSLSRKFVPIIAPHYGAEDYVPLDLSSTNKGLDVAVLQQPNVHHRQLQEFLKTKNAKVAYGGYLEQRKLYDRSDYFTSDKPDDRRNIHLGIDLWCEAGTVVLSPLQATVHSLQENTNFGDYGPTIILEHLEECHRFYTLYGHLSRESLSGLSVGQKIYAGQQIASLGTPAVNGDYAPHLHFQMIVDLQGNMGDYPGVASRSLVEFYKTNCPDPNLLLKIY